ncbi:hypothetical protein ABW21_db0202833 [Orbilia brochopaga]|nr:hypothetical protein ABW21_db0202833 [Drechslerella brochopaga]
MAQVQQRLEAERTERSPVFISGLFVIPVTYAGWWLNERGVAGTGTICLSPYLRARQRVRPRKCRMALDTIFQVDTRCLWKQCQELSCGVIAVSGGSRFREAVGNAPPFR